MSSQSLRSYLIEMIVYGCIINKLNKEPIKDISIYKAMSTLK